MIEELSSRPGRSCCSPGQDVLQVHLHPAARRGGGKAAGLRAHDRPGMAGGLLLPAAGPGQREPGGLGPAALGGPGPAKEREARAGAAGPSGRRGPGLSSELTLFFPSCSRPRGSLFFSPLQGRRSPWEIDRSGPHRGSSDYSDGTRGVGEHLARSWGPLPDSLTVNLLKVVSLDRDKRNGLTLFGFVLFCLGVGTQDGGVSSSGRVFWQGAAHPSRFRNLARFCFRRPGGRTQLDLLIGA